MPYPPTSSRVRTALRPRNISQSADQYIRVKQLKAKDVVTGHYLRIEGNKAVNENKGDHREALQKLEMASELAFWCHRSFGHAPDFQPGPFAPPRPPEPPEHALAQELDALRAQFDQHRTEAERAQAQIDDLAEQHLSAEQRAIRERMAKDLESRLAVQEQTLAALQADAERQPAERQARIADARRAKRKIKLDDAATRALIDAQLRRPASARRARQVRARLGGSRRNRLGSGAPVVASCCP
ncbi:hypothetical protein [Haliangium ochraceum]|uniref:hypothetical protein n=1 Tax=Haliangium ochraceum TaxID=80816 RepID=UPI00019BA601|nr:hypothetical protein [Haliangium ochraceum]